MIAQNYLEDNADPPNHHAKIAIIGGGSLHCSGFIQNLIQHPNTLRGCQITLMDIDEERLNLTYTLASKLLQQANTGIQIEKTTSQEEAIEDASFVLITFRTGGMRARVIDEKLPLRHNLIGQDTVGAGGFFYALRTAPVIAGIAAEIEKLAPKAFLLNYTSPSNIVTEAISHASGIRVIGMEDHPYPETDLILQRAGIGAESKKRIHPRKIGLSHGNWTTAIWRDGENILPGAIKWYEDFVQNNPTINEENYPTVLLARLATQYGAIPSYYMHYYYYPDIVLEYQRQRKQTPTEKLIERMPELIATYKKEASNDHPDVSQIMNFPGDLGLSSRALSVMRSILNDTGEEWVLNVPNNGSINFLADDRVVELPCRVDARGATPLTQKDGGLSLDQRGLIAALAEYEGATARVALWGTRKDAIKALAANPLVWSYSKAEKVYDDLAMAHKQYLPQRLLN
ncbi:6-phospho-beta-glucosidase [Dictyobacter sp. S3.2.2.5]|uniref:6-phospho-beta-glucosidase n=1 Tax=Dictyobacter halimunensis TaxID=3026934 RepID=A0ABQ6G4I4_9CHLR|nr:6-phospho-beta-glucosidase [Dictyobacter sp. S3.2.2.5]